MPNSKDCQTRPAHRTIKCLAAVIALFVATGAIASMEASTFTTQMLDGATCTIDSASTLNFAGPGTLGANVDRASTIEVTCTNSTPYSVGLAAGTYTDTIMVTVTY